VLLPKSGGGKELRRRFLETERGDIDIYYTVEDILHLYAEVDEPHLNLPVTGRAVFDAFPLLIRVPEGQELAEASRLLQFPEVAAAVPNFLVSPCQNPNPLQMNVQVLENIVSILWAQVKSSECGMGVRVAVLDTGIDPQVVTSPNLHRVQYDADKPRDPATGHVPYDPVGHGTVVASIINAIAPAATIISVKVMEEIGDLMGVLSGLYLSEHRAQPHIYNLSLGIRCEFEKCPKCKYLKRHPHLVWQVGQLFASFHLHGKAGADDPLVIAAAGNGTEELLAPARFPEALAVGAFDFGKMDVAAYSRYTDIPSDRFLLAPGGLNSDADCIATKNNGGYGVRRFYGTSFATAFVTGVAARYACAGPCANDPLRREQIWTCLCASANRDIPGYSQQKHGMGVVRYDLQISQNSRVQFGSAQLQGVSPCPLAAPPRAFGIQELRAEVSRRAYALWESQGYPDGLSLDHWFAARRSLAIPAEVKV
jgi:hypothetical protein